MKLGWKHWIGIWVAATIIGFFTRKNSSMIEPFLVGSGVTFIIFMGTRLMRTYDKVADRIEEAARKRNKR